MNDASMFAQQLAAERDTTTRRIESIAGDLRWLGDRLSALASELSASDPSARAISGAAADAMRLLMLELPNLGLHLLIQPVAGANYAEGHLPSGYPGAREG